MEKNNIIANNSDFLFLYDAAQCNPNGDPDQENKPRMDYDTQTNLVTDTRLKRYIRDYLSLSGQYVFVNMEDDKKVGMDTKMKAVLTQLFNDSNSLDSFFVEDPTMKTKFEEIKSKRKDGEDLVKFFVNKKPESIELNKYLLAQLVKEKFTDIRMFGCAFAVDGFTKPYTGPIQINWGFSLHKVQLMDSSSIVTIMNDDSSTFGKDYRVHYSLLAFNGTINKFAAQSTGLTCADVETFRDAIWNSVPSLPTRSKLNQYPKLYVEVVYNDGFYNGCLGDLRNYLKVTPNNSLEETQIRKFDELTLDLSALKSVLAENTGQGKAIKEVVVKSASGITFSV
ncbi:MAG: type I-B CRISPR-associated protein Cas7/Csh2 [Spirosomataceae bacterium]